MGLGLLLGDLGAGQEKMMGEQLAEATAPLPSAMADGSLWTCVVLYPSSELFPPSVPREQLLYYVGKEGDGAQTEDEVL
jgi:hypothetical protein